MLQPRAGSRSATCTVVTLALLCASTAPSRGGTPIPIFPNGFETGLCAWSPVVTPESCDGMDNDCDTLIDEDGVCMICGDGFILFPPEECDDAPPAEDGDGCSATCTIEHGFGCTGEPSICFATCGDGLIAAGLEGCDDQNVVGGDGCSATCNIEGGWQCAGEPSVCTPV